MEQAKEMCNRNSASSMEMPNCCGNHQEENNATVLQHIMLDMTGNPVTGDSFSNAAVHRAFRRKRRLLDRTNTVLVSRMGIMVVFALMLVGTSLVTWYFTTSYSKKALNHAAYALRRQLLQSSLQSMSVILGQTYNLSNTLSSLHQDIIDAKANNTEDEIRRINWAFFKTQEQLSSVGFLNKDGYAVDYARYEGVDYLFFANQSTSGSWYMQNVTASGKANGLVTRPSKSPLNNIKLFDISRVNQTHWSIELGMLGEPVVVTALPVTLSPKAIFGVSVITSSLRSLTNYLSTVNLLGGYLYVVWRNDNQNSKMVAVSYSTQESDVLCEAQHASNPVVADASRFLETRHKQELEENAEVHAEDVFLRGSRYYVDTLPLAGNNFSNLKLTAIVIIPRKSILGRLESLKQTVVAVSIGIAIAIAIVGCILICGLTSRMRTEMELKGELLKLFVEKQRAELSSNHKSQFLANMSHELRTPMAGILGLLDLLSCDTLTTEQEISVAQIRKCAVGLLTLVNNVLDISKVEAGKMELNLAPFNLFDELESLVDMFSPQSFGSGVDVALDLSDEIPQILKGDAFRIRQIFSNLLSNSLKFTEQGHVVIRGWVESPGQPQIALPPIAQGNNIVVVFEIDDTGCGIPPHMHETVFESFVQADPSFTRIHGGSGLGLCIVRSLVQKMGGEIHIIPKEESGTLIRFRITLERVNEMVMESVLSSPSPDSLSSMIGSPATIQTPPFGLLERTQVLVAMARGVAASTCIRWLEKQGMKVTHVTRWMDIIPAVEAMVRTTTDSKFVSREWRKAGYNSDATDFSPFSGCSSRTLESLLDLNGCPVLAVIDVALFPREKPAGVPELQADTGSREPSEACRISAPLLDLLNFFSSIHHRHSLAVGWIVPPDSGISFKKTLQSIATSVILIKPLHASRMKRVLALVQRACKVEPASSEPPSCISSNPSTPRLTRNGTPVREGSYSTGAIYPERSNLVKQQADGRGHREATTTFKETAAVSSDAAYHSDGYLLSTPGSPTSGLLTPEGANTMADGVQEARKDVKDLENEWSGPVIDLSIPPRPKSTSSARSPFSLPESELSTMPSTSNSSPIHAASGLASKALSDLQILVVEDTPILQRMVSTMLRKFGAQVTVVGDGQQAVNTVAQSLESNSVGFDLILMDCAMPVMDGYSATKAIREAELNTGRHIPIVALTAHALTSDEAKCRAVGMDAYLTKPINCKLMVSTIQDLVKKRD